MPWATRDTTPLAEFGRRMRALRKELKLSQEKLGEHADLHRTYIGAIERGERNPSLTIMIEIADALDVDLGDLTDGLGTIEAGSRA
jgi:transcriptional regulator with XRE-family HTH domain